MCVFSCRRKKYEVRQQDERDCAAACISSVCSYFGKEIPVARVRDMCGTTSAGANIKGIVDAAASLHLSAVPLKSKDKGWDSFSSLEFPAVAHLEKADGWSHFVVVYEAKCDSVMVMDPAEGQMVTVGKERWNEEWTGYIVLLYPDSGFEKGDKKVDVLGRFREVLLLNKKELLLAFAGAVLFIAVGLSSSIFIQQIVDVAIPSHNHEMVRVFAIVMAVMAVLSIVVGYGRTVLVIKAGLFTDSHLVMEYFRKLLKLPVSFFSFRSVGELDSRVRDVYRIRNFLTVRLMLICVCVLTVLSSFVLMFTFCWKMAMVIIVYIPLYVVLYKVSDKVNRRLNRQVIEKGAAFESESVEVLSGVRTIRYYGWEELFLKKLEDRYDAFVKSSWKGGKWLAGFAVTSDGMARILTYAVLIIGASLVFKGTLSTGELVSFFSVTSFFTSPVNSLIESNNEIAQASIAAERLFEVMDLEPESGEGGDEIPSDASGNIKVEGVSFSYPGGPPLLDNVSVVFRMGEVTAVKGSNGSGKSTLAGMLMRGIVPVSGRIVLDGKDISDFNLDLWRKYVTLVPQKAELFKGSILENVAPGEENPDAERIAELCVVTGLAESLGKFPEGMMSDVGEGGSRLSGGERQKVALVRALYRNPQVLILDEATASVDDGGRERILSLLRDLAAKGKTIIMITHDDACLTAADRIVTVGQQIT